MACSLAPAYFHHCRSRASMCWSRALSGDSGDTPSGPAPASKPRTASPASTCSCAASATTHSLLNRKNDIPMLRPESQVCHSADREWGAGWGRMGPVFDSDALFEFEPAAGGDGGFAELARRPLCELVALDWAEALAPVEAQLRAALAFLAGEVASGHAVLPAPPNLL